MKEKLLELLNLQNRLNEMTNGPEWKEGMTNKGKEINWFNAMLLETTEAIDSTPWKHWKSIEAKTDIENLKIEIVDDFHFLESHLISKYGIEKSLELIDKNMKNFKLSENFDYKDFNISAKKFMFLILDEELNKAENDDKIVKEFVEMMGKAMLSFEELYKLYIMKNALNLIRQRNGYKEGTYVKIWDGKEDNVYLHNILETNKNIRFDEIIVKLQNKYDTCIG